MSSLLKSKLEGLAAETAELLKKHEEAPTPETNEALEKSMSDMQQAADAFRSSRSGSEAVRKALAMLGAEGAGSADPEASERLSKGARSDWAGGLAERISGSEFVKSGARGSSDGQIIKAPLVSSRPASGSSTAPDHLDIGGLIPAESLGVRDMIAQRRYMWTDLCRITPVSQGSVDWIELIDDTLGNPAAETAEASAKPITGGYRYEKKTASTRTIAVMQEVTRQALADVPQLDSIIRNGLTKRIRSRVNAQIAAGDGVGENLTGILTRAIPTHTIGADPLFLATLKAIQAVELGSNAAEDEDFYTVNAIVMNPNTWLSDAFATARDTTGRFILVDPRQRIDMATAWGLPVITTKKMPAGKVLVGDFGFAEIFDRQQMELFVTDSHNDNFGKNILTLLAELRLGFEITSLAAFKMVQP